MIHRQAAFSPKSKEGKFRQADGGSLFLDEVSEASLSIQLNDRTDQARPLRNLEIGFRKRALEIFRGTLPPQRSARKDDCLSAKREFEESAERSEANFVFAAKRGGAGPK